MAATPFSFSKDNMLAFAKQTAKGTPATTGFELIPTMPNEQTLDFDPQWAWLQYGGGYRGKIHYASKGLKVDGKLIIPAVPGYVLDPASPIGMWLTQVQNAAAYFQGYYATIVKGIVIGSSIYVEQYSDVKCAGGAINFAYGNEIGVLVDANLMGLADPTTSEDLVPATWPSGIATHLFDGVPWTFAEAAISLDTGAGLVSEPLSNTHSLEWDMVLEEIDALNGAMAPADAPNTEWPDWKGGFERPLTNVAIRQAFLNGDECAYKAILSRGGGECTISMPRIVYDKAPLDPGTKGVVKQTVGFQALSSLSDKTAAGMPCIITESAGS